ncbi:hypothetical protein COP1_023818 [Malus domestica]
MSAAAGVPSRAEVLTMFRSFLRVARKFTDYNIREYTKRKAVDAFRQNRNLSDPSAISAAFSDGKAQLEVAKRQAVIYSLYAPKLKSVMEVCEIFTSVDERFEGPFVML